MGLSETEWKLTVQKNKLDFCESQRWSESKRESLELATFVLRNNTLPVHKESFIQQLQLLECSLVIMTRHFISLLISSSLFIFHNHVSSSYRELLPMREPRFNVE